MEKKPTYSEKKAQKFNSMVQSMLSDYFCVGLDKDGDRMYDIKLNISSSTPRRQRYDRYVGLLGQIQDIKQYVKIMWLQYQEMVDKDNQKREQVNQTQFLDQLDQETDQEDDDKRT